MNGGSGQPGRGSKGHISVMGQELVLPDTLHQVAGLFVLCTMLAVVAFLVLDSLGNRDRVDGAMRVFAVVTAEMGSSREVQTDQQLIGFWTPAKNTESARPWEEAVTDSMITEFTVIARRFPGARGVRRSSIVGIGGSEMKTGWWWWMRVVTGEFEPAAFESRYRDYWRVPTDDPFYMEFIGGEGGYNR